MRKQRDIPTRLGPDPARDVPDPHDEVADAPIAAAIAITAPEALAAFATNPARVPAKTASTTSNMVVLAKNCRSSLVAAKNVYVWPTPRSSSVLGREVAVASGVELGVGSSEPVHADHMGGVLRAAVDDTKESERADEKQDREEDDREPVEATVEVRCLPDQREMTTLADTSVRKFAIRTSSSFWAGAPKGEQAPMLGDQNLRANRTAARLDWMFPRRTTSIQRRISPDGRA